MRERERGPPVDGLKLNKVGLSGYFASKIFRLHAVEQKHLLLVGLLHVGFLILISCSKPSDGYFRKGLICRQ